MHPNDTPACFARHLGLWAAYAPWMQEHLWAFQQGLWHPPVTSEWWGMHLAEQPWRAVSVASSVPLAPSVLYGRTEAGTALIRVTGALTKMPNEKMGGTSTMLTRRALRLATADPETKNILLAIDSPGGQVPGVAEVVDAIWQARAVKPVAAYLEDLAASGAYWIASAAQRITGNSSGLFGNIGTFTVLEDFSGAAERQGVKIRVVATGPFKGAGVPGTEITQAIIDDTQRLVDQFGMKFFEAVQRGRRMSDQSLTAVTDGRIWMAHDAQALGLIDGIESFDEALAGVAQLLAPRQRMATAHQELARLRAAWETVDHG
jgi:signal peptide peptidase SppA